MENLSLYNILVGYFDSDRISPIDVDESYFERLSEEKKLRQSIIENLKLILQTRQGSVLHLPDFGLPDIMQIYLDAGGSLEPVKTQICNTILKYEPRIAKVTVQKTDFDPNNMRVSLKIMASIKEFPSKELLLTEFSTTGWTKVVFEKDLK